MNARSSSSPIAKALSGFVIGLSRFRLFFFFLSFFMFLSAKTMAETILPSNSFYERSYCPWIINIEDNLFIENFFRLYFFSEFDHLERSYTSKFSNKKINVNVHSKIDYNKLIDNITSFISSATDNYIAFSKNAIDSINIYIVEEDEYYNISKDYTFLKNNIHINCFAARIENQSNGEIYKSDIYINNKIDNSSVELCLIEELLQSIGPINDIEYSETIFNDKNDLAIPTIFDYGVIKFAYRNQIPLKNYGLIIRHALAKERYRCRDDYKE